MRTPPEHDRAMLHTDAAALRDCAARLEALTGDGLPAQCGPDWSGILAALAGRCRVAATELEQAAAFLGDDAPDRTRAALALAGALLRAPRAASAPLAPLAPLARRLPGR
jgi:hypothetical protein